ncbi:MAG: hypothetical protein ONB44_24205 [candidate division KSB1 bacterium]|nr:hypothetical protein [candidate division KSB1 bacterium]MDZ7305238.1 hypothetical protein [candidate division KSB1 bacterium]MDZ7311505.1 hypothetical protein [candidate division KSB1 bacterium]
MKPFVMIFVCMSLFPALALSQTVPGTTPPEAQDTLKAKAPAGEREVKAERMVRSTKPDSLEVGREMELDAIAIEAVIEKPNVDIIPKRLKPELEEMEFIERSFDRELKEVPKDLLLLDDELDRAARLEGLKKLLEKKKKK